MSNPLYSPDLGPNGATAPTKSVNETPVNTRRTHNVFNNSYLNYLTLPFGRIMPYFYMHCVPGDKIPLHSKHTVRSFPMSSPFLNSIKLNKDNFMVPMQAILPNSWELIYKQPQQGDDVPDDANCTLNLMPGDQNLFATILVNFVNAYNTVYGSTQNEVPTTTAEMVRNFFVTLFTCELFFSSSSLFNSLGYHITPFFYNDDDPTNRISFDSYFDIICNSITIRFSLHDRKFTNAKGSTEFTFISTPELISILRENLDDVVFEPFFSASFFHSYTKSNIPEPWSGLDRVINLGPLYAYQLCCAHYYVNPQVDFIYNAQLYRDNVINLVKAYASAASFVQNIDTFSYNGISIPYDFLSSHYLDPVIAEFCENPYTSSKGLAFYNLCYYLFGVRESLKFGDYFTDCRTRPYALGTFDAPVVGQGVSAIDMTKSIVMQRFANSVIKLRGDFSDYLKGIFGTLPSPDYHFPKYISHSEFDVKSFEVANTSDKTGQLVTNLESSEDNFAFEVDVDMPCIIISCCYMSVPRSYMQTKDRFYFHKDRFDMFNPMLQYLGDQPVYQRERTDMAKNSDIFGYQSRNGEYKQRYNVLSGAFMDILTSWVFCTDNVYGAQPDPSLALVQSPEFIRSHEYEFDRYFAAVAGPSLGHRFHFILVFNNDCQSLRPMEISPGIL